VEKNLLNLNGDIERDFKTCEEKGRGIMPVMLGDKEKGDARVGRSSRKVCK